MGRMSLESMIAEAGPYVALEWHLSSNFYPPLDPGARKVARIVFTHIQAGTYSPDEVIEWQMANDDYGTVHAGVVVETLHLEPFLDYLAQDTATSDIMIAEGNEDE